MKIRMLTGLSGPDICLMNGDEPEEGTFTDAEAQALIDAGFAELADNPPVKTTKAKG